MLNRGMLSAVVGGMLAVLATSSAWGYTFDQINVEGWTGPGSNHRAVEVVDFGGGNSFCFGYQWNDGQTVDRPTGAVSLGYSATVAANTTEAALISLDQTFPGLVIYHYDANPDYLLGLEVDAFHYQGHSIVSGFDATFTIYAYPTFWLSDDGQNWNSSQLGTTQRMLSDGCYDGWTQGDYDMMTYASYAAEPQVTAVPEPATMTLLVLGGAWVLRRRNVRA